MKVEELRIDLVKWVEGITNCSGNGKETKTQIKLEEENEII